MKLPNISSFYKFISRLSPKEKLIFYVASVFVLLAFLDRLIIYPVYSRMKSLDRQIEDKETQIKKNLRIVSQKDRILSESAKLAVFFNKLQSEEEEATSFLKDIENLANKSSVYISDMKPAGSKTEGATKKYLINVNCEASMEKLAEFMYNIENSARVTVIEKYEITAKSKDAGSAKCSLTVAKITMP